MSVEELCSAGMTREAIDDCLLVGEAAQASSFHPVSLTWPMGFAWSSNIAQEFLLDVCNAASLDETRVLSCEAPTPACFDLAFAAGTDGVMIFSDAGVGCTLAVANQLDEEFLRRGVIRNEAKDVNDELNATCVGVAFEDCMHLLVPPTRCMAMLVGMLSLLTCRVASPKQVHQQLGTQQWFDLLCRCKRSVYDKVYSFVKDPLDTHPWKVPPSVPFELSVGMLLGVFWRLDLQRPLSATDASTDFGLVVVLPGCRKLLFAGFLAFLRSKKVMCCWTVVMSDVPLKAGWGKLIASTSA